MPPSSRRLSKRPLRAPQQPPVALSYTQTPTLKRETDVNRPGSKQVEYKEASLTTLRQPFVNPSDAFAHLTLGEHDK
ncbi:hypothetical protein VTI74DRAFT_1657 [Chaetomium olivicolor]